MTHFHRMQADRILFIVSLVVVFVLQNTSTNNSAESIVVAGACHPGSRLWVYPIIATVLYAVGYILAQVSKHNANSLLNFATALLVVPFVDRVIQSCHLAIITYVTIEYSLRSLRSAVKTKSDMGRVVMGECLKLYVYIAYVHIDSVYDDYHTVTLYIVLDAIFTMCGCMLASMQINSDANTGYIFITIYIYIYIYITGFLKQI